MEFRQVVQSVCRSAATASRQPLIIASTRPSASGFLLHHRQFTTNNKQQKPDAAAAAAAATAQPHSQPPPPPGPTGGQASIEHLQASISKSNSGLPPRPAPIRRTNFFIDHEADRPQKNSWFAAPQQQQQQLPGRETTSTGSAPPPATSSPTLTWSSSTSGDDPFSLVDQIQSDAERAAAGTSGGTLGDATGTGSSLTNFNEPRFLHAHYGPQQGEPRLRPSTGRTIEVKGSVDVARGFRLLQRAVQQNGIRRDVYLQRAHERPALKRKRQRRERWRARFRQGFRATIARVMELKAQGW